MGYTYRNNGQIQDFWPDNTPTKMYFSGSSNLSCVLNDAKDHFGENFNLAKISISSEHIHTYARTFDLFDIADWTTFIVLEIEE